MRKGLGNVCYKRNNDDCAVFCVPFFGYSEVWKPKQL